MRKYDTYEAKGERVLVCFQQLVPQGQKNSEAFHLGKNNSRVCWCSAQGMAVEHWQHTHQYLKTQYST
jgi:hypothetical protein